MLGTLVAIQLLIGVREESMTESLVLAEEVLNSRIVSIRSLGAPHGGRETRFPSRQLQILMRIQDTELILSDWIK